jgi:hypothetical protein
MEFKQFEKICNLLIKESEDHSKLNEISIDLINFVDPYHEIINILLNEIYGKEGLEWFQWFAYESDFGKRDWTKHDSYQKIDGKMVKIKEAGEKRNGASDKDGNSICFDVYSTWKYLEENYRA